MAQKILAALIFILLPLALLSGVIFRYSAISFIYAFLLLALPWLGPTNERNIRRRFRLFILIIGLVSFLTVLAQIIFQSILLANKPYGHTLDNCTESTQILRYFGLERLDHPNAIHVLRLISPDIIILAVSIICFVIIQRIVKTIKNRQTNEFGILVSTSSSTTSSTGTISLRQIRLFVEFVTVGIAAFVYPSIINSMYLIFFLTLAFMWSLSIKLGKTYKLVRALLVIYAGVHLLTFYLYQFGFFQDYLQPLSLWSNITGLTAIVRNNCTDKDPYLERHLAWNDYINPCALLIFYFSFAFETNETISQRVRSNVITDQSHEQQPINESSSRRNSDQQSLVHSSEGRETREQTIMVSHRFTVSSIVRILKRHNYLLSLIAMLSWSITFHSLLTLIYLLWACLLWVLPNCRQRCFKMSPYFTTYGGILLVLQYVAGFKVSFAQYSFPYDRQIMQQIGFDVNDFQPAFKPLLMKSFYMVFFWFTLREYISEPQTDNQGTEARRLSTSADSYARRLERWFTNFFTKYWIFVSCGMLLLVSIQNTVVIYRIIYMVFYLFFMLSFQISFGFWRKTTATFHLTIIIYSMFVLIGIYIYQFQIIQEFLLANFSKELLLSIGFEVLPSDILALRLLTPSAFLVVNILQLYYFHSDLIKLIKMPSDKNIEGPPTATLREIHAYARKNTTHPISSNTQRILNNEPKIWQESLHKYYIRLNLVYKQITYYTWRFSEIHIYKFVLFIMVLVSVLKVCAFNVILIILATIGLTLFRLRKLINLLTLIATGLYILASMCYQLPIAKQKIIEKHFFVRNCSQNSTFIPDDTAKWYGLELTPSIDRFLGLYILLTIVLTFDAITQYRQRHRCLSLSIYFNVHLIKNPFPTLFEPLALKNVNDDAYEFEMINYQDADKGIRECLKYLANFIFYRFGLEICYITTVIVVCIRLDIAAVLYAVWLGLFLVSTRRFVKRIWPFYILFLTIAFSVQYMSAVGAPPYLCFEYPWTESQVAGWPQLRRWLFLPDYVNPPLATQLIADFFQFLFACQQWRIFKYESSDENRDYTEAGGSNREIIYDKNVSEENPTRNFIIDKRHWLDRIKYAIFMYSIWCVLSIVYLAGITRISIFGLGYLIACFYFFWYGQDFLIEKVSVMLRSWSYLIYYCFAVIFVKTCLQVVVCIYLYQSVPCDGPDIGSTFCTFVDLLVPCLKSDFIPSRNCSMPYSTTNQPCDKSVADASLFMDGFCMIFLLLQKRIFGSSYWEHIVTELRSQATFADRLCIKEREAADSSNYIAHKRNVEKDKDEEKRLEKIIQSLKRTKKRKSKLYESDGRAADALLEPSEHFQAIRSGDYYMFDSESDQEEEEEKPAEATVAQEQILQVLASNDEPVAATATTPKSPSSSPPPESDSQEPPTMPPLESEPLPATTMMVIPSSPIEEDKASLEPKAESKETQKSFLIKMRLIGQIVEDYFIDLLNRNSRNYRKISKDLSDMKSADRITQQEEQRPAQTIVGTASVVDLDNVDRIDPPAEQTGTLTLSQAADLKERSHFYRLLAALFYFTMSRSELLCYTAMVINHLTSGTLLSMPLPLSIFLWAMSSSRPSRKYWITVITYTEAMITIKFLFQFRFYPWNALDVTDPNPLSPVNIIGIDQNENRVSVADLFLLLSLFLHRSILIQFGMWKEKSTENVPVDPDAVPADQQEITEEAPKVKTCMHVKSRIIKFYQQREQASYVPDVYASMFFCDFINICIILGFYSQFGNMIVINGRLYFNDRDKTMK